MLFYNINTIFFIFFFCFVGGGGGGGGGGGYVELLFFQRCKVLAESKVADKYLTLLMQNTKYCKEVTFESKKVNVC